MTLSLRSIGAARSAGAATSVALFGLLFLAASTAASGAADALSFEERVACQRAIERVYHDHRLWPAENPGAKPRFDQAVPREVSAARVRSALRASSALASFWKRPLTGADLQAELDRLARQSQRPAMLQEILGALDGDPRLAAECLARPLLAERRARALYAWDPVIHAPLRRRAEEERAAVSGSAQMRQMSGAYVEREWPAARASRMGLVPGRLSPVEETETALAVHALLSIEGDRARVASVVWRKPALDEWLDRQAFPLGIDLPARRYTLPVPSAVAEAAGAPEGEWTPTAGVPEGVEGLSTVWTGAEVIVWGGSKRDTGSIYDPATDSWTGMAEIGAPSPRLEQAAVWTGKELVVWGGCGQIANFCEVATGGRYDPVTNSWRPVSGAGAPPPRRRFTGVWTGRELIVWGGCRTGSFGNNACEIELGDGGRYDPEADLWRPMSTAGAPLPRTEHTAVWTGREMIVWGGTPNLPTDTGGRYDPASDTWQPTSTAGAPAPRANHTAVWTGDEMIVWGGCDNAVCAATSARFGDGARYDPVADTWMPVGPAGAPAPRANHVAVWTGTVMIVWGGRDATGLATRTGGRYDPLADAWTETSTIGAPPVAEDAVWIGTEMFVWGNQEKTGGRYDPAADAWLPVDNSDPGEARRNAATAWTGTEMIVWSGDAVPDALHATGDRYDPATGVWRPMSEVGQPVQRERGATAVWTGSEVVIWGGQTGTRIYDTGGRYDPLTDTWRPTATLGAPSARTDHTAVWTGTEMIVWGGNATTGITDSGGRYDPAADAWLPTSTTGAPGPRRFHTAVWTGDRMLVWGGLGPAGDLDTGGLYDPAGNAWAPISAAGAPSPRHYHSAHWTGTEMIVWGGMEGNLSNGTYLGDGGRYDLASDGWTPLATSGAPSPRIWHGSAFTGSELLIWGGCSGPTSCPDAVYTGGRYDLASDTWRPLSEIGVPLARSEFPHVWTGDALLVWGGVAESFGSFTTTGGLFAPGVEPLPREVSPPGAIQPLAFASPVTLVWEDGAPSNSDRFNLYRGLTATLSAGGDAACLLADLTSPTADDPAAPPAGASWYYLVAGENATGEGPLGRSSSGAGRGVASSCP